METRESISFHKFPKDPLVMKEVDWKVLSKRFFVLITKEFAVPKHFYKE